MKSNRVALIKLVELVVNTPDWIMRFNQLKDENTVLHRITQRFRQIDDALKAGAALDSSRVGMGTTLTVAVSLGPTLLIGHIGDDLLNDTLTILKSKTEAGLRIIPLTPDAVDVFTKLRERSELFGTVEPAHYVFASFKPCGRFERQEIVEHRLLNFDPSKPLGSWKKAWARLTTKAGLPGLRFHDLRHHSITELAESGASEQTIKAIAGHVSQRMLERYSHIRLEAKRNALEALSTSKPATVPQINQKEVVEVLIN